MSKEDNTIANGAWHLRKDVTLGNIFTSIIAILAIISAYYSLDKRLALVEQHQESAIEVNRKTNEGVIKRLDRIEQLMIDYMRRKK